MKNACSFWFTIILMIIVKTVYSQIPNLGTAANFAMFTSAGAFSNDGLTVVSGDIGTNVGAFSGFPPGIVVGGIHVADPVTAQAAADLSLAYGSLSAVPCGLVLGTTLGNDQYLTPNVYCLGAASVLNGTLYLDGQCNPNAVFIFKIDGALSTSDFSNIVLSNNASLCNIYWQVNGAVALGGSSIFQGNILANGAISLAPMASLLGRGLSVAGAISMHNNTVDNDMFPKASTVVALGPTSFCQGGSVVLTGNCGGVWNTGETTESISVTNPGTYYTTNTNTCGAAVSNSILVTIFPNPDCLITGINTICAGETTQLCVAAGYTSYLWSTGDATNCIDVSTAGTYSVTITNINGCTSMCSKDVLVNSSPPCTITGGNSICAGQSTTICVPIGAAGYLWNTLETTNCINVITPGLYSVTVTSATGCTSVCSKTISVGALPACSITGNDLICLGQSTTLCATPGMTSYLWSNAATTSCITVNAIGTYSITITNALGCTSECSIDISIVPDNIGPDIICPNDITIQCDASILPANTGTATATDNCTASPTITYTTITIPGNCNQAYTLVRTWKATDLSGNTSVCDQSISVIDNIAPIISCPANLTVECNTSTLPSITGNATATDNCSTSISINYTDQIVPGSCPQAFQILRTWTATDGCSNTSSCIQTISIIDNIAPVISCPPNLTVQCNSSTLPATTGNATATDNCSTLISINYTDQIVPGSCPQAFQILRTWIATDDCGNLSNCIQIISVIDNIAPVILCPANITVECNTGTLPSMTGNATATDNCSTLIAINYTDQIVPGNCPQAFQINRTWIASDGCGNSSSCIQSISVIDNIAPVISCPANITVECNLGTLPSVTGNATATDNCSSIISINHTDQIIAGSCSGAFQIIRTWTATDGCSNASNCIQTISVINNIAPVILCPANITVECNASTLPSSTGNATATDICSTLISVNYTDQIIAGNCPQAFQIFRKWTATDDCGNSSSCIQTINVVDQTPPTISFKNPDMTDGGTFNVQCFGQDPKWDIPVFDETSIVATDICAGVVSVKFNKLLVKKGDCKIDGFINLFRLTWTATDQCGNSSSKFIFLALVDTIAPIINGVPDDITLNCDEISIAPVLVYGQDECLCACTVNFEETFTLPGCQNGQIITRTWTASDACGNMTTSIQQIKLVDTKGPDWVVNLPNAPNIKNNTILEYDCYEGFPGFLDELSNQYVFGPNTCGESFLISFDVTKKTSNNCKQDAYLEQRTYQWKGKDLCGNESSFTLFARLVDKTAPKFVGLPDVGCLSDVSFNSIKAIDACGKTFVAYQDKLIASPCGNGQAVSRMYSAEDECGNIGRDTLLLLPDDGSTPIIKFVNPLLIQIKSGEEMTINCESNNGNYTSFNESDVMVEDACNLGLTVDFKEILVKTGDCIKDGFIAQVLLQWTATDVCGKSSVLSIKAKIVDETSPVFQNFKPEITIACKDQIPVLQAIDNCGIVFTTTTDSIIKSTCIYEYDIQRIITATDQCDNSSTIKQVIHVGDGLGPVISGVVPVICDDLSIPKVTAYDQCSGNFVEVMMQTETIVNPCNELIIHRTWTAYNICGHKTVVHQYVIENDHTPPVIIFPGDSILIPIQHKIYTSQTDLLDFLNHLDIHSVVVKDGCDTSIITILKISSVFSSNCIDSGFVEKRIFTWTATDACGNSSTKSISIKIIDNTPPVFTIFPPDVTIVCKPLPESFDMIAYDGGHSMPVSYTQEVTPSKVKGVFNVIRTWTAIDICGNITKYKQHISWEPNTFIDCNIIIPDVVECNSHGVIISSVLIGAQGPLTYEWKIVGSECFIQGGQGTPSITIYIGWEDVRIILTTTDEFGCVSICTATLTCQLAANTKFSGSFDKLSLNSIAVNSSSNNEINNNNLTKLSIWPNPASSILSIGFESINENDIELHIINSIGLDVYTMKYGVKIGANIIPIDVDKFKNGAYVLQIKTPHELINRKVLILNAN